MRTSVRKSMRARWAPLCLAALLCLTSGLTAACGSDAARPAATGALEEVRVGVIPIVDIAPLYLGVAQGFFTKRGIKVVPQVGQGGGSIIPSVVNGQLQFGFSNITSLVVARAKSLPVRMVAAGNYTTGIVGADFGGVVVPADSDITGPADLAGHTVGINNFNNIGDTTVRQSVRKAGGNPSSIHFVELAFPDAPAAVQSHQVDAAWVVEPFLSIALGRGARLIASNLADADPNLLVAAYFTSEQLMASNPGLVARFRAAVEESLTYAQRNPAQARGILASYTKIDPTVADKIILPRWSPDINPSSVQVLVDLARRDGLIATSPDLSALLPPVA